MKSRNKIISGLLVWVTAVPFIGNASESATETDNIVAEVLGNNADLKARAAEIRSAGLMNAADNRLGGPDVDFEHQWGQKGVGNKWSVGISQSFEWPGLYGARRSANRKADAAMIAAYNQAAFELNQQVRMLLVDVVSAKQRRSAVVEMMDNLRSVKEKTAKAFEQGEATILEMNKIELQLFSLETKLEDIDCELITLSGQINALNGGIPVRLDAVVDYGAEGLLAEERYMELIDQYDTQLAALRAEIESKRAGADVERLKRYPGFSLGYVHNVEIGEHFNGVSLGVSLPMFTGKHRERAALSDAEAAEYNLDACRSQLHAALLSDYAVATKLGERIDSRKSLFTDGRYGDALAKAFNGGQMNLLDYLYETNFFIETKFDYIDLVARYHKLLVSLNRYNHGV